MSAGSPARKSPFAPYAISTAYPQVPSDPPPSFLSSLFRDRPRHATSASVLSDTEQAFTVASDSTGSPPRECASAPSFPTLTAN